MDMLLDNTIDGVQDSLYRTDEVVFMILQACNVSSKTTTDIMARILETVPGESITKKEEPFAGFKAFLQDNERLFNYHAYYSGFRLAQSGNEGIMLLSNDELIDLEGACKFPNVQMNALNLDACFKYFEANFSSKQNLLLREYYNEYIAYIKKECLAYVLVGYLMYNQIMMFSVPSFAQDNSIAFTIYERICKYSEGRH